PQGFGTQVTAEPPADVFSAAVARGLARLREDGGSLRKIVLSRSLRITAGSDISIPALIARLAVDDAVVTFATPELLVERRGSRVFSHPLAGSARRSPDAARDREAAEALLRSEKDRREHALVVEQIMDVLSPFCMELQAPDGVTLKATRSMWHLGTRIKGTLKDIGTSSVELAALLHPTPAVCGMPRREADAVIRDLEGYDRGFYAGAVGWCDSSGDGRWYVSIRCAEIEGRHARLYAGAGIVPGSTPEGELAETAHKFAAMLEAFGLSAAQIGEA
ncbi:isochorismate synthase, partial [Brevundimonas sp.]|uniref:isochorismate synthase n=1 Tax=Brevundimonas sp. TaxID=1871086 RepID=UPI0019BFA143